jgi:hypothetical protein
MSGIDNPLQSLFSNSFPNDLSTEAGIESARAILTNAFAALDTDSIKRGGASAMMYDEAYIMLEIDNQKVLDAIGSIGSNSNDPQIESWKSTQSTAIMKDLNALYPIGASAQSGDLETASAILSSAGILGHGNVVLGNVIANTVLGTGSAIHSAQAIASKFISIFGNAPAEVISANAQNPTMSGVRDAVTWIENSVASGHGTGYIVSTGESVKSAAWNYITHPTDANALTVESAVASFSGALSSAGVKPATIISFESTLLTYIPPSISGLEGLIGTANRSAKKKVGFLSDDGAALQNTVSNALAHPSLANGLAVDSAMITYSIEAKKDGVSEKNIDAVLTRVMQIIPQSPVSLGDPAVHGKALAYYADPSYSKAVDFSDAVISQSGSMYRNDATEAQVHAFVNNAVAAVPASPLAVNIAVADANALVNAPNDPDLAVAIRQRSEQKDPKNQDVTDEGNKFRSVVSQYLANPNATTSAKVISEQKTYEDKLRSHGAGSQSLTEIDTAVQITFTGVSGGKRTQPLYTDLGDTKVVWSDMVQDDQ